MFPVGSRPTRADLCALLDAPEPAVVGRCVHHSGQGAHATAVLASGLAFSVEGLAPEGPARTAAPRDFYGFDGELAWNALEAVTIAPSAHIAAGKGMQPVVRTLLDLAVDLAMRLPVVAVTWNPAQTVMEPRYFARLTCHWLAGGVFPAPGLTALVQADDGTVSSRGLAYFIGQEIRVEQDDADAPGAGMRRALRLVDYLFRHGPLLASCTIAGGTEMLFATPSRSGRRIWVWRDGGTHG